MIYIKTLLLRILFRGRRFGVVDDEEEEEEVEKKCFKLTGWVGFGRVFFFFLSFWGLLLMLLMMMMMMRRIGEQNRTE